VIDLDTNEAQQWRVIDLGDGTYEIQSVRSGRARTRGLATKRRSEAHLSAGIPTLLGAGRDAARWHSLP
jgi:hypothetical protein